MLSRDFYRVTESIILTSGEPAILIAAPSGLSIEIDDKHLTKLGFSWQHAAPVVRALSEQWAAELTKPETVAVIDNVSRNNFNLFALAFPRLIDGTYQSMTFRDANNRELSVSYPTTSADIINLDVSYHRPDGHRAFVPMIQFYVNHENRMLTVNGYADDDMDGDAWQCPFCRTINKSGRT